MHRQQAVNGISPFVSTEIADGHHSINFTAMISPEPNADDAVDKTKSGAGRKQTMELCQPAIPSQLKDRDYNQLMLKAFADTRCLHVVDGMLGTENTCGYHTQARADLCR